MDSDLTRDIQTVFRQRVVPGDATRHGLVIGIENYGNTDLNLRCAAADAQAVYDLMVDPDCGMFPKENVTLLLDAEATFPNVRRAFSELVRKANEDDTVWIYYAGHGAPQGSNIYWVTYGADVDDLYGTGLANDDISKFLNDIRAERLIVLLDCCHAAATSIQKDRTRAIPTAKELFAAYSGKGRLTISSSNGTQKSVELSDKGHGAFTWFLQQGLRGEADLDGDGIVSADELWQYLDQNVAAASQRVGNPQTPVLQGQMTHHLALTLNPSACDRKERIAAAIGRLVGLGPNSLTTDEANYCLTILLGGPKGKEERVIAAQFENLAAGNQDIALFKLALKKIPRDKDGARWQIPHETWEAWQKRMKGYFHRPEISRKAKEVWEKSTERFGRRAVPDKPVATDKTSLVIIGVLVGLAILGVLVCGGLLMLLANASSSGSSQPEGPVEIETEFEAPVPPAPSAYEPSATQRFRRTRRWKAI